jgi:hypothetical protein
MKWRLYICSDCDLDEGVVIVQVPDDAHEDHSCGVDYCPGCGDYLSFTNMGEVEVTGNALIHLKMRTPAEEE